MYIYTSLYNYDFFNCRVIVVFGYTALNTLYTVLHVHIGKLNMSTRVFFYQAMLDCINFVI